MLFDKNLPGFSVLLTPKGKKSYCIIYRDEYGKQRQEKIADLLTMSVLKARKIAQSRLQEIAQKKDKTDTPYKVIFPSMEQFFYNKFLPLFKITSRSYKTHDSIFRNHIQPVFGEKLLNDITENDVVDFNIHLRNKQNSLIKHKRNIPILSESTVKRIMILLRHIFNVAIRDASIALKINPTHVLRLCTVRKVRGRFLGKNQLAALLNAAKQSENKDLVDIIKVMGATGLRRKNVLSMQWSWFNEEQGTLTIPPEYDKAKQGFMVYLADGVIQLLQNRRSLVQGPWVFPNDKTNKPYFSCRAAWEKTIERANLHGLRMHDLRHTFASMMLNSGSDIIDVQRALGHTQLKTTAVYLHLTEGRKRANANAAVAATGILF